MGRCTGHRNKTLVLSPFGTIVPYVYIQRAFITFDRLFHKVILFALYSVDRKSVMFCNLQNEIDIGHDIWLFKRLGNIARREENADNLVRKHCEQRRRCCLSAFSPFPTIFSNAFFLRYV